MRELADKLSPVSWWRPNILLLGEFCWPPGQDHLDGLLRLRMGTACSLQSYAMCLYLTEAQTQSMGW